MRLDGIHHITLITGDAPRNVDFYTRVVGLRLVAKSVNQDDPTVYHLFYADEHAQPGADLTFFEYPRAIPGRAGAGMIHTILWRVGSPESLDFWAQRLGEEGVDVARAEDRVRFSDPEGMAYELLVSDAPDAPLIADHPEIPAEHAIRGFEGVRAYSAHPERSAPVLEKIAGGTKVDDRTWELRGQNRGGFITYDPPPTEPGRQSAGTVHHIAWGTTMAEHPKWADRLSDAGIPHSGIIDRHYFHSIYFREPSGVLFEIADDGPGFTVDGPVEELGRRIILPPRFEPHRERIESILTPLPDPRADWPART
jgi:glyoxalase family protein